MAMTWMDRLRALFRREAADAKEWAAEVEASLDEELTRRERTLSADPDERLRATLEEIDASDEAFERMRREIDAPRPPARPEDTGPEGPGETP